MKKHVVRCALFVLCAALPFVAPAQRLPESCRDSTPSLRERYAPYFTLGAASYADDEEDELIKVKEKEDKKKAKEEKKKAKAAEKARKQAAKEQKKKQQQPAADAGYGESAGGSGDAAQEEEDSFFVRTVGKHFTELSSGTKLLPVRLLGKKPAKFSRFTASDGLSYEVPAKWDSQYLALFLDEARKAGVQVRFHLLVCPEMTPEWFFFRGYDSASRLAGKDEMAARLEWYIRTVTDFIADWEYEHNQGQPLVTSYDVVSELFTDTGALNRTPFDYLMKIFGDSSYAVQTFCFAASRVPDSVRLCYCDHSLFEPEKAARIKEFIGSVRAAGRGGRVDEIGVISHLTADWPERGAFFRACRDFSAMGLGVQIQQLDIAGRSGTDSGSAYYDFMRDCVQNAAYIQGVSFRAVQAAKETEFVDYMRAPLFLDDYSCTGNFDRILEAADGRKR